MGGILWFVEKSMDLKIGTVIKSPGYFSSINSSLEYFIMKKSIHKIAYLRNVSKWTNLVILVATLEPSVF